MKPSPKSLVVAVIFVVLIVGYYYYLSNRTDTSAEAKDTLSEVAYVTTENLTMNYPATPREVIKFYNRILLCYYDEEYTDEELSQMADQALLLFDEELLAKNPKEQYLAGVKADVADYERDGKTISNVTVAGSKDIRKETVNGRDYAFVDCVYYTREGSSFASVAQTYALRKDSDGQWKILAFFKTQAAPVEEQGNE